MGEIKCTHSLVVGIHSIVTEVNDMDGVNNSLQEEGVKGDAANAEKQFLKRVKNDHSVCATQ